MSTRLKPCPDKPNCVCSQHHDASDKVHHISPLKVSGEDPMARIKAVVTAMPRTEVKEEGDGYMRVVFTTAILRFRDDVEFELDADAGVVHVRSASRVGYSDLGLNRKRVEAIRAALS
ncbi:MAG: DUF1499 domain-containing protein [Myxococcota bacterium]